MGRTELLKCCRYYKGESDNPFTSNLPFYLWLTERSWIEREIEDENNEALSIESSEILSAYRDAGLIDFEKSDGIWVGLKASLFRLLQHWNEGMASLEAWTRFYEQWKDARL